MLCNKCGRSLHSGENNHGLQKVTSEHGYDSTWDGDRFTFSLCERCLLSLMLEFKIPPEYQNVIYKDHDTEPLNGKLKRYKQQFDEEDRLRELIKNPSTHAILVDDFRGKYHINVQVSWGKAYIILHLDRDSERGDEGFDKKIELDGILTDVHFFEWRPKPEDGFGDEIFEYHTDDLQKWLDSLSEEEVAEFMRQKTNTTVIARQIELGAAENEANRLLNKYDSTYDPWIDAPLTTEEKKCFEDADNDGEPWDDIIPIGPVTVEYCPFCGGFNLYTAKIVEEYGMFEYNAVACYDCSAQGPVKMSGNDDHINFWNKRCRGLKSK